MDRYRRDGYVVKLCTTRFVQSSISNERIICTPQPEEAFVKIDTEPYFAIARVYAPSPSVMRCAALVEWPESDTNLPVCPKCKSMQYTEPQAVC